MVSIGKMGGAEVEIDIYTLLYKLYTAAVLSLSCV